MPDDQVITDESPQRHRAGAWVVLLIGVVGLGIGVMQWRGSFGQVFASKVERFKTPAVLEAERIEGMKTKDTDADGLNDYEESYAYATSPYLADSDSDGTGDKEELAAGDDPNCPKGKECLSAVGTFETAAATGTPVTQKEEDAALQQFLNPTPDEIRRILRDSGASAEEVAGIDDATLLQLYRESLAEAQANLKQ